MRKEEKKRKKEEKKAAEKEKSDEPPVVSPEDDAEEREKTDKTETLTESIKELSVEDKVDGKKKEFSEDHSLANSRCY